MRSEATLRNVKLHKYTLIQTVQRREVTKNVFAIKNALTSKVWLRMTAGTSLVMVRATAEVDIVMAAIVQPEGPCGPILRQKVLDQRSRTQLMSMSV